MPERSRRTCRFTILSALLILVASSPAPARVDVTLDAGTLDGLLSAMAPREVKVPLTEGRSITLEIHDLRVNGFDPTEGEKQEGFVLTSLRLKVPELNLDLPLTPKLSLQVGDKNGKKLAYLRFEKIAVPLPITGTLDVAPLMPVLPLPTDTSWTVATDAGNVRVRTVLIDARMGVKNLRLGFDLEATKAP
jgi:hypothetical protein